jgi:chorismate mutase
MHDTANSRTLLDGRAVDERAEMSGTFFHALRGATVVPANTAEAIHTAARELLTMLVLHNAIPVEAIASIFFTVTPDLNAAFPAKAARQLGWRHIALMCATEIAVPGALPACLRVLIHFNASRPRDCYQPIYLHGAEQLLADDPPDEERQ